MHAATRVPSVPVLAPPAYRVFFPFRWKCTACQHVHGACRHNRAISETHQCSCGNGRLQFIKKFDVAQFHSPTGEDGDTAVGAQRKRHMKKLSSPSRPREKDAAVAARVRGSFGQRVHVGLTASSRRRRSWRQRQGTPSQSHTPASGAGAHTFNNYAAPGSKRARPDQYNQGTNDSETGNDSSPSKVASGSGMETGAQQPRAKMRRTEGGA